MNSFFSWLKSPPGGFFGVALALMPLMLFMSGDAGAATASGEVLAQAGSYKLPWTVQAMGVAGMLVAIAFVIWRLPKPDLGHSPDYRRRRSINWLTIGIAYAFLYMARYNLSTVNKLGFIEATDFSIINTVFAIVYGVSFLINGPLTDRFGGRATILVGVVGSAIVNLVIGLILPEGVRDANGAAIPYDSSVVTSLSILTGFNAYFQSFGAVAIVKVNAPWFHVRERGTFGAIFGILISLGLWLAFDVTSLIANEISIAWIFDGPAVVLFILALCIWFFVRDTPGQAGYRDFDTGDATSEEDSVRQPVMSIFKRMLTNPIILTIALIEFCSGFLRQSLLQYYRSYAGAIGHTDFVTENWGALSCIAGILGGIFAGLISDYVFKSRRGPVSAVLYGILIVGSLIAIPIYTSPLLLGPLILVMAMSIIGVHGMLSGTASMDFGGKKNTGIVVGIIDGFVYLGYAVMAAIYSQVLPSGEAAKDPANWDVWIYSLIPVSVIGFFLSLRVWNARPTKGKSGGH